MVTEPNTELEDEAKQQYWTEFPVGAGSPYCRQENTH